MLIDFSIMFFFYLRKTFMKNKIKKIASVVIVRVARGQIVK